jgi:Tol biopolymer transport system component
MLIVRVLAVALKPALAVSAVAASATGGVYGWQHWRGDDSTPFERLQSAGQQLLISEFGADADTIIAIDPNDVAGSRTEIATITHATEWGIFATLAPDGEAIAYTALPEDAIDPSPDTPATAAIVEAGGDVRTLATDIDLLIPPVWSPDSASIVVRKNTPAEDSAGAFELVLLGRDGLRVTITAWRSAAVFPIAFSPDGARLYFATLNAEGADLYRVAPDGSDETLIAHLSDEIARDWRLSPDGSTLAYSVAESGANPRIVAMKLDLASGGASEALAGSSPDAAQNDAAQINPAWRGDAELTIASIDAAGGGDAVSVDIDGATDTLTTNDDSIDLPVAWSPDGSTLAVRAVEGATPFEAGESHIELVTPAGDRERVSNSADVLIVGWLE